MLLSISLYLFILLQISIFVHIFFIAGYVSNKSSKNLKGFLVTFVSNMIILMSLMILVFKHPYLIRSFNLDFLLTLEAGLFFAFSIYTKIHITKNILKRRKDPANWHYSFLGKKVYEKNLVTMKELGLYFITLPFTLLIGAYFVVKLIIFFK